jgi:hypothetical protein
MARTSLSCFALIALALCSLSVTQAPLACSPSETPQAIYAADPQDPWNRIFFFLFTRRVQIRMSDEFPEAAPFLDNPGNQTLPSVSSRTFDRLEWGDRAIDPLYYPFRHSPEGRRYMYLEPTYAQFTDALQDALRETSPRSPIARVLMQNDLWAAYDLLHDPLFPQDRTEVLTSRRQRTLDLLAQLIRKLALTPSEINALPQNYSLAQQRNSLPDLFNAQSGWIEIGWFPGRQHDAAAGYRCFTRIFLKPAHPPRNLKRFLNSLPDSTEDLSTQIDGLALVMQLLLIDSRGRVTPSPLVTDVQLRLFPKSNDSLSQKALIRVCELSRKLMLDDPSSGGLSAEKEDSPAYLGGLSFASPQFDNPRSEPGPPILVRLRTRCISCHGADLKQVQTFAIARPPQFHPPPVRVLNPESSEAAKFSLEQQTKSATFQQLQGYFRAARAPLLVH